MRHRVGGYHLNRDTEHRKAMWKNQAIAFFTHGQITTTITKAKAVQSFVERLITLARKGTLAARRRVIQAIGNPFLIDRDLKDFDRKALKAEGIIVNKYHELQRGPRVVVKLFDDIAKSMADRNGGYTRIIKLQTRRLGDGTQLCILQLVGKEEGPQVSGDYSRRRQKAHRRTAYAAEVRKKRGEAAAAAQAAPAPAAEASAGQQPA